MIIGIERDIPIQIYNMALAVRRWVIREAGDSSGMCGEASDEICRRLKGTRYRPVYCCGSFRCEADCFWEGHCWVRFGRIILDVTADQFNVDLTGIKMKPIVYGTRTELMRLYDDW